MSEVSASPEQAAQVLNERLDGWCAAMSLRFIRASRDEVVAELVVGPQHHQAYGIVHGGVHCGIIETLASVGAALDVMPLGKHIVGLENSTSFIRAVREGTLTAIATPLTRGRRSQVWEGRVQDPEGKLVATGRVRLLCLDNDSQVGGEKVGWKV